MGPRPACSMITRLPYSVLLVPRLHAIQIWLDWPAGHRGRRGFGEVGTQGRWREKPDRGRQIELRPHLWPRSPSLDPSLGSQVTLRGPNTPYLGRRGGKQQHGGKGAVEERMEAIREVGQEPQEHFQGLRPHAGPLGRSLDGRLTGKQLPFYRKRCLPTISTPCGPTAERKPAGRSSQWSFISTLSRQAFCF